MIVTDCYAQVRERLQSIAGVKGRVLTVYDADELLEKTAAITLPAAGVVYEGMRAVPDGGNSLRAGISCEGVFTIVLLTSSPSSSGSTQSSMVRSHELLDQIRKTMMATRSPSGHLWRFLVEAASTTKGGSLMWIQRWTTPIQLVQ